MLSDAPWRNKLARRIISLPAALRVCLLVLAGSFFGSVPAQASHVSLPVSGPPVNFAIADFDGDGRPNLAIVQPGSNSSPLTIYRIQVQLGDGGLQSLDLVGPSGGIRIATRDLNEDGNPDLIVSLAWRQESLAVLLNNGHAVFSRADPSAFPRASNGSETTLNGNLQGSTGTVATPPRLPVGDFSGSKYLLHPSPATGSIPRANFATLRSLLLESLLGRAPPTPSCA